MVHQAASKSGSDARVFDMIKLNGEWFVIKL